MSDDATTGAAGAAPEVVVQPSADELAQSTADRTTAALAAAITARGVAHLVVTGGGILEQVLAALAPRAEALDWSAVHVWWGDERWVPADSEDRNDRPARAKLFDRVPVDPAKLHPMPAADAGFDDAEAAAQAYAAALAEAADGADTPAFDVVLLGIGPDGHCASLFPGHPGTAVLDRSVIAVHDSPKPPPDRLSLTFPALDAAREIWFVASGSGKAEAVARAVAGADRTEVPSAGPRGRERTLWLVDEDAAAGLES
ncbi:6-phosphogluconolactonase [Jatrophihabitans endophyticus]|uniref:6-phosphogluconolactonase n=1 Tax=Jatrophihabitans endophyticus TaxID=1206085 RepID=A0A1M5N153_9ACTN|nr:6-phosphogluconolactonase [Jatrophihabitans endophyticus]SHG82713.1 6-phosphogluconolactonase [Jatrophihabitans endophyticus]